MGVAKYSNIKGLGNSLGSRFRKEGYRHTGIPR
jgi:hypothetical protein